jgi:hypothetical protein
MIHLRGSTPPVDAGPRSPAGPGVKDDSPLECGPDSAYRRSRRGELTRYDATPAGDDRAGPQNRSEMHATFPPEALEQVAAVIRAKRWGGSGRGHPQNLVPDAGPMGTSGA